MREKIKAENKPGVAFIVPDIYPCATGGMEIFYFNLVRELKDKENIILITACKDFNVPGVETIKVKKKFLGIPGSGRFFLPIKIFLTLIKHRKKIKVIHFPYTSNAGKWGYVLPLIKKLFDVQYVLHLHGGGMRKWKPFSGNKVLFRNASELIAVSDLIKNEYDKRTKRNLRLIYPLVPFVRATAEKSAIKKSKGFSDSDKIILFVGSLKTLKSPDILLKAFHNLGLEYIKKERLHLILIGKGNLKETLEREVVNAGLEKHVTITGLIPYDEIPAYFKMADIYIMPSQFEGTPKSLLEAMFNKLPIIASDVTGINNVLSDNKNALLFPVDNVEELSERLRILVSNNRLAQELGENAYKHYCSKYSFDETMNQLIEIYSKYDNE